MKNKQINILLFLFFLSAMFVACRKTLSKTEFVELVNNGEVYNKKYSDDKYELTCRYTPSKYLALKELRSKSGINENKAFEAECKNFDNAIYLDLNIGLKTKQKIIESLVGTQQEYSGLLSSLTYMMQDNFFSLNEKGDTIKPLYCNYSNTYNNSPNIKITFCFSKERLNAIKEDQIKFIYKDNIFGTRTNPEFVFTTEELFYGIPKIKEIE